MPELMEHQIEGVEWLRGRSHSLLADEPGLGKSAQELLSATEPILVVAPAMVLDSGTWDDEVEKWAPGASVTQVAYSSLAGREKTKKGGTRPTEVPKDEYRGPWGTTIADESHYLKGRKTTWTKALAKVETERMRLCTGTPLPNWAHEAFTSLQFIYPEEAKPGGRFGSYWRWAREWFDVGPTIWSPMAVGELRADRTWDEFQEANWGDRYLKRLRDDCLDLPPLTVQEWEVKPTPEQRKVYRGLKEDFVAWVSTGEEVVAWNSAAQTVKLLKVATGLEVIDPSLRGSGKLDALRTILADRPRPTLVVAFFQDSVKACARVAEEVGAEVRMVHGGQTRRENKEAIRSFKAGSLPVLCASVEMVAEGMTLTAADQIVRVERSWRPYKNEQVIRRLHRIGQERPVLVIDLLTKGTADIGQRDLLRSKTDQQMRALPVTEFTKAL